MRIRRRLGTIFLSLCVFAVACSTCFAENQAIKSAQEANRLYQKGKFDEALQKYNEASVAMPDSDIINFNMGAVLYRKGNYQKASESFIKALTSEDRQIEADALYNIGNCKYKLGKLKENTDLSGAVSFLRESLDYYKRAVEANQKNKDARINYEFVERELKALLDKVKQQQPNKGKPGNQQGQTQDEQQKQNESSEGKEQGAEKKEKEQSGKAEAEQQEKEKEGQGQPQKEESQKQQEQGQARKEEPQQEGENKELSEEGARTLLERYGREEATPDYMDKETRQGYDSQVLKDW